MGKYAPACIFAWKRPEFFAKAIASLQKCELIDKTEVFVFIDGPKEEKDTKYINKNIKIAEGIKAKKLHIIRREENFGLKRNIKEGISEVLKENDRVIVIEEDLIFSRDFLIFMNKMLEIYQDEKTVAGVSGFSPPIKIPEDYKYSVFFFYRVSSWGWGTWKRVWEKFIQTEITPEDVYKIIRNENEFHRFSMGGYDLPQILFLNNVEKKINVWGIEFQYFVSRINGLFVYPVKSKVKHIGWEKGQDTGYIRKKYEDFPFQENQNEKEYNIPEKPFVDWRIFSEFHRYIEEKRKPFTLYEKILNFLYNPGLLERKLKKKFSEIINWGNKR